MPGACTWFRQWPQLGLGGLGRSSLVQAAREVLMGWSRLPRLGVPGWHLPCKYQVTVHAGPVSAQSASEGVLFLWAQGHSLGSIPLLLSLLSLLSQREAGTTKHPDPQCFLALHSRASSQNAIIGMSSFCLAIRKLTQAASGLGLFLGIPGADDADTPCLAA